MTGSNPKCPYTHSVNFFVALCPRLRTPLAHAVVRVIITFTLLTGVRPMPASVPLSITTRPRSRFQKQSNNASKCPTRMPSHHRCQIRRLFSVIIHAPDICPKHQMRWHSSRTYASIVFPTAVPKEKREKGRKGVQRSEDRCEKEARSQIAEEYASMQVNPQSQ